MEDSVPPPVSSPPLALLPPILPPPVAVRDRTEAPPPPRPQAPTRPIERPQKAALAGALVSVLALLVAAAAYYRVTSDKATATANKASKDVISLMRSTQSAFNAIGPAIGEIKQQVLSLQNSTNELQWKMFAGSGVTEPAILNLAKKGHGVAHNEYGAFPVSVEDAEPCLDGHKVRFRIGNLAAASVTSVSLRITYGPQEPDLPGNFGTLNEVEKQKALQDYGRRLVENQKNRRTLIVNTEKDFPPASWNFVDVAFSGSKPEELGRLAVIVNAKGLALAQPAVPTEFSGPMGDIR